jgi:hypothetical protein
MVQYTIDEADKANQGEIFLIATNIDEMSRPLPPREEILWREVKRCMEPRDMGLAFAVSYKRVLNGPRPKCMN